MHLVTLRDGALELADRPLPPRPILSTGRTELDAILPWGGIPLGQVSEVTGSASSGKLALAVGIIKEAMGAMVPAQVAFIDGGQCLFPPALAAAGIPVEKMLIVRPRTPDEGAWAADVLLRSHELDLVVLDLPRCSGGQAHALPSPGGGGPLDFARDGQAPALRSGAERIPAAALARLSRFARESDCALLLVTERSHAAEAGVALTIHSVRRPGRAELHVRLEKVRGGMPGREAILACSAAA